MTEDPDRRIDKIDEQLRKARQEAAASDDPKVQETLEEVADAAADLRKVLEEIREGRPCGDSE